MPACYASDFIMLHDIVYNPSLLPHFRRSRGRDFIVNGCCSSILRLPLEEVSPELRRVERPVAIMQRRVDVREEVPDYSFRSQHVLLK